MALDHQPDMSLADQLAAVQAWWADAGVDCAFVDEPQAMLGEVEVVEAAPQPTVRRKPMVQVVEAVTPTQVYTANDLPTTLAAFRAWWCDPATPLPGPSAPRIASRGEVGAKLMLLAPMPEAEDGEAVFSGPQGRLLRNMLGALGVREEEAFFATALPANMALPDWEGLAAEGLGAVIAHQIALAQPERVLVLGSPLAPMLADLALPKLATFAPDQLLAHPRQCARLWARLLDWMPA